MNSTSTLPSPFIIPATRRRHSIDLLGVALFGATALLAPSVHAIPVPNSSFESNVGVIGVNQGTSSATSWINNAEPTYWSQVFGSPFSWVGTSGVFNGTPANGVANPYANLLGNQGGYILDFPGAALLQDSLTPGGLNANFLIGNTYTFTLGVYAPKTMAATAALQLAFYYRNTADTSTDPLGAKVIIGTPTTIAYSTSTFPNVTPSSGTVNFIDYSVGIGAVQGGDLWANKPIGLLAVAQNSNLFASSGQNWDVENARLVPEPTTTGLIAVGLGGLLLRRQRRVSQA